MPNPTCIPDISLLLPDPDQVQTGTGGRPDCPCPSRLALRQPARAESLSHHWTILPGTGMAIHVSAEHKLCAES